MTSNFRETDLVRLITQCLHGLGYSHAAETLERDSGVQLCSAPVLNVRTGVLCGDWEAVESLVPQLQL